MTAFALVAASVTEFVVLIESLDIRVDAATAERGLNSG